MNPKISKLKAFCVQDRDNNEYNVCVITTSPTKAKSLASKEELLCDSDYIDLRAKRISKGDIIGLPEGAISDYNNALQRGLFGIITNGDCPNCNAVEVTVSYENGFSCNKCNGDEE